MSQDPRATSAGNSIHMIRSHLRDIPQVPLPENYTIRPVRADEGALWTEIVLAAEEWLDLSSDLFVQEFGLDLQSAAERCFFILNDQDYAVGTISAWYRHDYRGLDYGLIHWVANRPAYQGLGLGKAGLSFALTTLAQWHDRALLGTQTKRLPAIALYLNFGFLPDLEEPGAREDWQGLKEQLKHPALEHLDL
ncbi:MAG TPA: GNAT family N-acetyltransferase [Candidatus Latescibacteria bacterium]|nr:GNAT family N-acetyltransferase [Candidatus Handelsmanbacteria bacterium]HIL07637.1 GNAT family N-acetyltransferase [Candidatus Latescibacterota bacterium]